MCKPSWIGVDWGTSNLRAFAIDEQGQVLEERSSVRGMSVLKPDEFEAALLELIDPWLQQGKKTPVFACGMVGAKQGWFETIYRSVPCLPVSRQNLTQVETSDPRIQVKILPGLSQADPADVMRGEETQIAGLLSLNPTFTGAVCLPGTHSKWVYIADGQVKSFQTFMTGEMFAIISKHSVLRHSLSDGLLDKDVFKKAALNAVKNPLILATKMFGLRAGSLLNGEEPQRASARLSGMLVGQELAIVRDHWDGKDVTIIGAYEISQLYTEILTELGAEVKSLGASEATLSGLKMAANEAA